MGRPGQRRVVPIQPNVTKYGVVTVPPAMPMHQPVLDQFGIPLDEDDDDEPISTLDANGEEVGICLYMFIFIYVWICMGIFEYDVSMSMSEHLKHNLTLPFPSFPGLFIKLLIMHPYYLLCRSIIMIIRNPNPYSIFCI